MAHKNTSVRDDGYLLKQICSIHVCTRDMLIWNKNQNFQNMEIFNCFISLFMETIIIFNIIIS